MDPRLGSDYPIYSKDEFRDSKTGEAVNTRYAGRCYVGDALFETGFNGDGTRFWECVRPAAQGPVGADPAVLSGVQAHLRSALESLTTLVQPEIRPDRHLQEGCDLFEALDVVATMERPSITQILESYGYAEEARALRQVSLAWQLSKDLVRESTLSNCISNGVPLPKIYAAQSAAEWGLYPTHPRAEVVAIELNRSFNLLCNEVLPELAAGRITRPAAADQITVPMNNLMGASWMQEAGTQDPAAKSVLGFLVERSLATTPHPGASPAIAPAKSAPSL